MKLSYENLDLRKSLSFILQLYIHTIIQITSGFIQVEHVSYVYIYTCHLQNSDRSKGIIQKLMSYDPSLQLSKVDELVSLAPFAVSFPKSTPEARHYSSHSQSPSTSSAPSANTIVEGVRYALCALTHTQVRECYFEFDLTRSHDVKIPLHGAKQAS